MRCQHARVDAYNSTCSRYACVVFDKASLWLHATKRRFVSGVASCHTASITTRPLGLVLLLVVARLGLAEPLHVEHEVVTRQAQADNGTAHVYVRNVSGQPVHVESVALVEPDVPPAEWLADVAASDETGQSKEPYLWARSLPNPIPPQGFADLAVKLTHVPRRKITLRIAGQDFETFEQTIERVNDSLNICSVGFPPEMDVVCAYIESRLDEPIILRRVFMNGNEVTSRVRLPLETIPPRGKALVVISLAEPLAAGSAIFLRVLGEPAAEGVTLVRAFSVFPVTWLDGSVPKGMGSTGRPSNIRQGSVSGEGLAGIENIMRCPAHAHGTRPEAAAKFIAAHEKLMHDEPTIPGMIYVCRWEKEINYFVFAELGDVVRVMPFAGSASYQPDPLNHRLQWLIALAVRAAGPRPVHAVVPIRFADSHQWERSITPDEVRALVYLSLSRGAKGLCYGRHDSGLSQDAESELLKVTREVDGLRSYLVFAEPMPWGRTNRPQVEAATLLAGDRAMVLLVINHSFGDFDNGRVLQCVLEDNVRSEIVLPAGMKVEAIRDVEDDQRVVVWRQEDDRLFVETQGLRVVRPYLVIFRSNPATAAQSSAS